MSRSHTIRIIGAFAAIYFIWGSTYLAIKVVVAYLPPLLMAALRSLIAGSILLGWALTRGVPLPTHRQWVNGIIAGALMFLVGHGTLFWGSQRLSSGLIAVFESTMPLWAAAFGVFGAHGRVPGKRTVAGLIMGLAGIACLYAPQTGANVDRLASAAVLAGAASWALAMVWYRGSRRPESTALASALPLVMGGVMLLMASGLTESHGALALSAIPWTAFASFAYLVVFGSVVAFSAFSWLVAVASPTAVASYAFVNPIVAVFLGWRIGGEVFSLGTLVAATVVLASVAFIAVGERSRVAQTRGSPAGPSHLGTCSSETETRRSLSAHASACMPMNRHSI